MADGDAAVSFNSSVIFRPSTEEVAAELPDRCKDDAGNYLEDWTAETQPTQAQVEELIDQAVRDVALRTGTQLEDEELIGSARHLVVLRAAMLVERRFFRQQVAAGQSTYEQMRSEWTDGLGALTKAIREEAAGGDAGAIDDAAAPAYGFPPASGIGRCAR